MGSKFENLCSPHLAAVSSFSLLPQKPMPQLAAFSKPPQPSLLQDNRPQSFLLNTPPNTSKFPLLSLNAPQDPDIPVNLWPLKLPCSGFMPHSHCQVRGS